MSRREPAPMAPRMLSACTNFYLNVANLSDEEAADIMGWEPARCRAIRKRYVDPARIAVGIVKRMEKRKVGP